VGLRTGMDAWIRGLTPAPEAEPRFLDCPARNLVTISTEIPPVLNLYSRMMTETG
jgi:hypothetical protein